MKVYTLVEVDLVNNGNWPKKVYTFESRTAAAEKMVALYKERLKSDRKWESDGDGYDKKLTEEFAYISGSYYLAIHESWLGLEFKDVMTEDEMLVCSEDFGDNSEHVFKFRCYDGYAESDEGVRLIYPKLADLTPAEVQEIIDYTGGAVTDSGTLTPWDVALKFGKVIVPKIGYFWTASSNDGSYRDHSPIGEAFKTEKDAYNNMRDAALEKMKWNTQYDEDFGADCDGPIGYTVEFEPTKIVHESYSGIYTYQIHKAEFYRDFVLTAEEMEGGWQGFADNNMVTLNTPCFWESKADAIHEIREIVDEYIDGREGYGKKNS